MTFSQNMHAESDLDKVYDNFMRIMIMEMNLDNLEEVVVPDITGFGTTIDERIHGLADCIKLVENQIKESENATFLFDRQHMRKRMLAGGLAAMFVEEGEIKLELPDGKVEFPFRITTMLDKIDGRWRVVHWHGSTPVMSEEDTWHINDWKKKNQELESKVTEKTAELVASLAELKATQNQLVVQEKLAALGQLAAGIAHEIKNPLNFVNNFSEVSQELIEEALAELALVKTRHVLSHEKREASDERHAFSQDAGSLDEVMSSLADVQSNLTKIHQHGTRADSIVKSMLMHSRGGSGILEHTDLNELIREYVNLAFHGMRAGKNPINVKIDYELDEGIGSIPVYPEDFSRVVLNLCKNAFDAMRDKTRLSQNGAYLPLLTVKSDKKNNHVMISFQDNGPGIPEDMRNKLFEPFFTTKKGTEGTGLGLSITHDIVKNHKGQISVESEPDAYSRFIIELPVTNQIKTP